MGERLAKKIRKAAKQRDREILPELKAFINTQPLRERLQFALKIIQGKF